MPCLLVSAANEWTKDDTNLFIMSSCVLTNTSQLDYFCTHNHHKNLPITMNDLNTVEISENLCGKYSNYQGMYHDICIYKQLNIITIAYNADTATGYSILR